MHGTSPYVEENARELQRMRSIVESLAGEELQLPVNDSWTVAGVLGHIAFWDGRALALADKLTRGGSFAASDDEPEDVDWINDASRPLIHAIPPAEAAALALRIAEETDDRVASLPPGLAAQGWPLADSSPLNLLRASHRREHLDDIVTALHR
jgi:Mycothiol maleylpyruvate isomerase N-terminal domain